MTSSRLLRHFYQRERLASQVSTQGVSTSIVWGRDAVLAQQCADGLQLLQANQPGSVLGVQRLALMHGMVYTPYGHRTDDEAAALLAFNGQWREPVTGGYLLGNGHRLFSPAIMRFQSPDSMSPFGAGGVNAYAYCSGDPVNLHDPSGRLGVKTGLTNLLNELALPKPQLRDYLKPLGRPEAFKQRRWVYRLNVGNFERFEFMGGGRKIIGSRRDDLPALQVSFNSENFYRSGDLYIPKSKVSQETGNGLLNAGFELIRFNTDTYAETLFPGEARNSVQGIADLNLHSSANVYSAGPGAAVESNRSTRNS